MAQIAMDQLFDLDLALTMVDYNSGIGTDQYEEPEEFSAEIDMPTVNADGSCTVCMEDFRREDGGKQVPCGHVFHATCISEWLRRHRSCPLCRFQVSGTTKVVA